MQPQITIRRKPCAEKPPHARVSLSDQLDERQFESALAPDGFMRPKFQLEGAPESGDYSERDQEKQQQEREGMGPDPIGAGIDDFPLAKTRSFLQSFSRDR